MTEVQTLQNGLNVVRRRAEARKATRVVKKEREREGHTKDPEAVVTAGGKA
jgi:hypothetical protein